MKNLSLIPKYSGLLIIVLLFGCSPKIGTSGFLSNYDLLTEDDLANNTMLGYRSPTLEYGKYQALMIDDIITLFGDKAKGNQVDHEKLNELTAFFKTEIINNFEPDYKIVNQPGKNVARLQIAITEIIPGKVTANIFPMSVALNTATGRNKGGLSIEMRIIDSQTKELLGQAMDNRKSRKYIESFSKFGNVRGVMKYWAKLMKERIDYFGGK